jgi:hypothetical protein
MLSMLRVFAQLLRSAFRSRLGLLAENALLRQQLIVAQRRLGGASRSLVWMGAFLDGSRLAVDADVAHGEAFPRRPTHATLDLSLRRDELLPEQRVLRLQCRTRPEGIDDEAAHELKRVEHGLSLPIFPADGISSQDGGNICVPRAT